MKNNSTKRIIYPKAEYLKSLPALEIYFKPLDNDLWELKEINYNIKYIVEESKIDEMSGINGILIEICKKIRNEKKYNKNSILIKEISNSMSQVIDIYYII